MSLVDGTVVAVQDLVSQPLYDSALIAAGAPSATIKIPFFTVPAGNGTTAFGGAGAKTYTDTNMSQQAQIPQGWAMEVRSIALVFWPALAAGILTGATDIANALLGSFIRLTTGGGSKEWLKTPAKLLPGGAGVDGFAATTVAATSLSAAHNGIADPRAVRALADPIIIPGAQAFQVDMEWPAVGPTITTALPVTLVLDGRLKRQA